MRTAIAGLLVGGVLGVVLARWGVCFNTAVREASFERRWRVLRVFAVAVAMQMLLLPGLIAVGVPVSRIGLYPLAEVVGGGVFGVGMALAGGCITGILWRTGSGSVATGLAIAGFAAGELLIRDPGAQIMRRLDRAGGHPSSTTVYGLLDVGYAPLAVVLGGACLAVLLVRSRVGVVPGVALGVLSAVAWVAADWVGYGYGLGFVGTATAVKHAIDGGRVGALSFEVYLAVGVVVGAALGGRFALRLPSPARAGRAVAGGVLMGVGGNVAHGCNIGHGLTGIPLLSIGSLLATASMAAGAAAMWGLRLRRFPLVRGRERHIRAT